MEGRETSRCWICQTQEEGLEGALVIPLMLHLRARNKIQGCRCEELRSDSGAVVAHFYRLECSHYCGSHVDHRCCLCRVKEGHG
jgi:hypothetical protein